MEDRKFAAVAVSPSRPGYDILTRRYGNLYSHTDDVRSDFARDYTRVLHSLAYRRLKHKTQVFFNAAENDHICTRIEHVSHVESVAVTIAKDLGLNTELTQAIALSHDLGHAPFGHHGERLLDRLSRKYLQEPFWHEKNGVYIVDHVELLRDPQNIFRNLDLTYAVRDGIICHCGEVDENGLKPRKDPVDLYTIEKPDPGKNVSTSPYTWEGCVVKISDKIAYLGRDIEDAERLGLLTEEDRNQLRKIAAAFDEHAVNTTVIISGMVSDICRNSTPEKGIALSPEMFRLLVELRDFNTRVIYRNSRLKPFEKYAALVIDELFHALSGLYEGPDTVWKIETDVRDIPFIRAFAEHLVKYTSGIRLTDMKWAEEINRMRKNENIYHDLSDPRDFYRACIDFIAGMTDSYAIHAFEELL